MSPADEPRRLPANPSQEHLRKAAKRLARAEGLQLAAAQRRLATDYGLQTWAELLRAVSAARGRSPLFAAAAAADAEAVRRMLADGAAVDGAPEDPGTPLWAACDCDGPAEARREIVRRLIDAGAFLHTDRAGEVPLHAAARRGPLALVEDLIAHGALEWQRDRKGRTPADVARSGEATDREAIAELLQRPVIRDPIFREAVGAIHAGDAGGLARLLDVHPRLLRDRIVEPDCYRRAERAQYFQDPKLFWFVADNPDLVTPMPAGMVDCARAMIARGVDQADLDYTLELAMTSGPASAAGLTGPMMAVLLDAGAKPTPRAVAMALGHEMIAPVEALLAAGHPVTASIAAALGRLEALDGLLPGLGPEARQEAFGLAVINGQAGAAQRLLQAGADVNAFMPVHVHATALHMAANRDDTAMLDLLLAHGARDDIADRMWGADALGWATHEGQAAARALLAARRG